MPPKNSSSSRRRHNPKLLRVKTKHKSLRGRNKSGLHAIPNVDAHVLSVATFLRMYPNSPSQDQFYTILRKTKTFRCFYSFVNEVFGNMDEQLFSVLFLSFMITTSGETSSFSFKDFIIRAVPNIEAAQIDEIDAGMIEIGNGLSNRVYEECVMTQNSSVGPGLMRRVPLPTVTRSRFHKPQTRRLRLRRPRRIIGGKRNIRKTRTNKKYVQTGGVLLYIAELITALFEIRRRFRRSNERSLLDRITPFLLLLFFILEITAQFTSIDYFGIGSGGSAAAVASAAADLTALETPSTGNLSAFIIGASQFIQSLMENAAAAGEEGQSIPRPGGYIPSSFPTTTVAQGAAAPNIVASRFISQLSFQQFDNTALEDAFEISPVETELNFGEFRRCLNLLTIAQNESRFAALLRGLQEDDIIPDSILEVPAARIHARLEQIIAEFSSEFDKAMGGSGAGVQCATSEGRTEGLNDRLSLQWSQHQSAMGRLQTAQEEHQFNERAGYFRLLGICGLVLSSASSRNLLRRVYYITRHLLVPPHPLVHEARRDSFFPGINKLLEIRESDAKGLRVRAGSPPPPVMAQSRLSDLPIELGNMDSAVEADIDVGPLVHKIGNMGLYPEYDEFGMPKDHNNP
jgi:hypothetical protein